MKFTRRTFLRGASLSLASVGAFYHDVIVTKNPLAQYSQVLAESTPRKLALLIGINKYPQGNPLRGCLTDVELQKELLINRFQFQSSDILSLTNQQATKENILTAFDEHLNKQIQNNDVVVIHFSGYGRQVALTEENAIANSLIAYDSISSTSKNQIANDLLLDTVINLCQSLKTKKFTLILDTSYSRSNIPLTGKLWLRSYPRKNEELAVISEEELTFNKQLKNPLIKPSITEANYNQISGAILTTSSENLATEITSNDFNAGLFTYNLTQTLWQSFPQTKNLLLLKNVNSEMTLSSFTGDKIKIIPDNKMELLPYYSPLTENTNGCALITKFIPPNNVELEFLGLPLIVLANYSQNSCLTTNLETGETIVVQINSITGNKAKGIVIKPPENTKIEGLILREFWRIINRKTGLTVALDDSLEKIEKVDATSALSVMENVESVINIGDDFADCILGKIKNNSNAQNIESYGLFSISGKLFPNTTAKTPHEAVTTGVKRLSNSLQLILTEKLLHLTLNQNSSPLAINASLEVNNNNQTFLIGKKSLNGQVNKLGETLNNPVNKPPKSVSNVTPNSELQLTIDNKNSYDLYCLFVNINSSQQISIYFSPETFMLSAGKSISINKDFNSFQWMVNTQKGIEELIVICSKFSFNKTTNYLYENTNLKPNKEQFIVLDDPKIFVNFILEDLHNSTNIHNSLISNLNLSEVYALNLSNWASFNFIYEII